ncbi:MAG TPA: serine/threonine-protein kinase, partial [Candidatus Polarisedimenticolaceae bacterium]|nr:serine/threonine-protein kinase [Candidatus Polarisedimenticolaceae bacterium]
MIGKRLAHYEILGPLGAGGMGEVYRARDTRLQREVALKILPAELARDPDRRARFEREARAVAALRHPSIVTIHAVEEDGGIPFLAMELVEGRSLTDVIPPGGLSLDRFLAIALPLADAVAAAHAKGITHRDLKPDNVMVEPDGRVKVLDFGLAKLLDAGPVDDATLAAAPDATQEGRILGTVAYMSPEQAEGRPVDARSDVFSLGVVLYQMITGERPFQGRTNISTLTAILRDTPPPVHHRQQTAPAQLDAIVQRCLEKAPERRYPTAKELRDDLERLRVEPVLPDKR